MAISVTLKNILEAKRTNPYSDKKSIQELRKEHHDAAVSIPLPVNTKWKTVDANGVPAELISCGKTTSKGIFLFIHGGGYYRGSAEVSRATVARISAAAGIRCLSIDYRLAPEHPFPAAIDDTYIAYKWLLGQSSLSKKIIVGGASAGGGLTIALLLKLKEKKEPQPAGAVPISPWTDMTQSGKTMITNAQIDPIISKEYLDRMSKLYLAGASPKTELASPLFGNLKGLPPILIQVGSAETMLDDSRRFVEKAKIANVDVEYENWKDMFHGWHGSAHILDDAKSAIKSIGNFCKRILNK